MVLLEYKDGRPSKTTEHRAHAHHTSLLVSTCVMVMPPKTLRSHENLTQNTRLSHLQPTACKPGPRYHCQSWNNSRQVHSQAYGSNTHKQNHTHWQEVEGMARNICASMPLCLPQHTRSTNTQNKTPTQHGTGASTATQQQHMHTISYGYDIKGLRHLLQSTPSCA